MQPDTEINQQSGQNKQGKDITLDQNKALSAKTNATSPNLNGVTYATRRRQEHQEALRERLRGEDLMSRILSDCGAEISPEELPVVRFKTETRLKLLNKILPDLKSVEATDGEGNPLQIIQQIALVALGHRD